MDEPALIFFVEPDGTEESPTGVRGGDDVGGAFEEYSPKRELVDRLRKRLPMPVQRLKRQVNQLVGLLSEVFDDAEAQVQQDKSDRQLQLEEIEVTVEMNAEGKLGILGNGGKAGGKGGIKLKFKRK
ncbi:hypothetical protein IQ266_25010 [filamentous cyanobacterium LEGE 11480]|uniref:Pepco domain-containing protein n=1 Tax=Romeriopsis navalis LEGE 11480 TaxID=2777977 RepID=A0A928VR63_9CYAN|nr:hypothetical protein [Romeriopsis navalis]MBE9033000.1 hypothetical protein [Romeriopsis navalis LEGE 11480]